MRKNGKVKARHVIEQDQLCFMQVVNTNIFKSNQIKTVFNIYYTIKCKSQQIIDLLECILCNIQYVGKSETSFNIRLKNHWKDMSNLKAIPADIHFRKEGHNFIQHAKFSRATNRNGKYQKSNFKTLIKIQQGFWILKLDNLSPKGLKQELNDVSQSNSYLCS